MYLAGPFLLGYTAGVPTITSLSSLRFWGLLFVFLLPANLLLYGVNDLCDRDTDRFNPKKGTRELNLQQSQERTLLWAVILAAVVLLAVLYLLPTSLTRYLMLSFLLLSVLYSAPPIRFKSRPFLDSASNILYAVPGFLGYALAGGVLAPGIIILAAGLWTASMHLYSAIPDIESDFRSGLITTATVLGRLKSLALCAFMWAGFAALLTFTRVLWPWCLLAWLYPAVPLVLCWRPAGDVDRVYWYFPLLNSGLGMLAFFVIALSRP
jgi:4-hydroxybenzoate polyprenyltransferase